jgi:hypothetical protein
MLTQVVVNPTTIRSRSQQPLRSYKNLDKRYCYNGTHSFINSLLPKVFCRILLVLESKMVLSVNINLHLQKLPPGQNYIEVIMSK